MDVEPIYLVFPDRLDEDGQEFVREYGVDLSGWRKLRKDAVDLGNGKVRFFHRCQHLLDDGRCNIYDKRPQMCRDFDCRTRADCACNGSGKVWQPIVVE